MSEAEYPRITKQCERCDGTGRAYDPTDADKVNAGPWVGRCSHCRGAGAVTTVALPAYPSAFDLGAIPEWDPSAELPDWMT